MADDESAGESPDIIEEEGAEVDNDERQPDESEEPKTEAVEVTEEVKEVEDVQQTEEVEGGEAGEVGEAGEAGEAVEAVEENVAAAEEENEGSNDSDDQRDSEGSSQYGKHDKRKSHGKGKKKRKTNTSLDQDNAKHSVEEDEDMEEGDESIYGDARRRTEVSIDGGEMRGQSEMKQLDEMKLEPHAEISSITVTSRRSMRGKLEDETDHDNESESLSVVFKTSGQDVEFVEYQDEVEEEEDPQLKRKLLVANYRDAIAARSRLQSKNAEVQHKLVEHFRKKKADETPLSTKATVEAEVKYKRLNARYDYVKGKLEMARVHCKAHTDHLKARCQARKEEVDAEKKIILEKQKKVALIYAGKTFMAARIEQQVKDLSNEEEEVFYTRFENIRHKNQVKRAETLLRSKDQLVEGLNIVDFERLKIENQTLNEKIEERNEELQKVRKKYTSAVQVLTHLKEKLQSVQKENFEKKNSLKEVESSMAQSREILTRTKRTRDCHRTDNLNLRCKSGLIGNNIILKDFEEKVDEKERLMKRLELLKDQHNYLIIECNLLKRKIKLANRAMSAKK